jgi:tetratricopeptide (TPR) repeat protein
MQGMRGTTSLASGVGRLTRCWLLVLLLASCVPAPRERLPTRAPTPTHTPTPTPFPISAQMYYEDGLARQRAGDADGALQSFSWAIQRSPDLVPAYVARGTVHLGRGELAQALADADAALEAGAASAAAKAAAYALRGEALRLLGRADPALKAFDEALALDPALRAETFRSRWLAARLAHRGGRLLALGAEYASAHPDDPLRHYYHAWAFIEGGTPGAAIEVLVEGIETTPHPPALLWFALGRAYMETLAWKESVTALEAARVLVQGGDTSLALQSDQPIAELFSTLGQAYLGAGRCVDAEVMLQYATDVLVRDVGAPASVYTATVGQARLCQTPTPTATPYPTTTPYLW